jgi:hypothetical protein
MIYVGMGEDHGVDALGIEGQIVVPLKRLESVPLKQAAI